MKKEKIKIKKTIKKRCVVASLREIILIYLLTSTGLFALDLEEARLLALANSPSLKKHEIAIRSSVLDERNQLYSMLPQISAEYRANSYYLYNGDFVNPADTFSSGANISITQIIFQGGKSFLQKAISKIGTESARLSALTEYYNVLDSIDNAYYAVLEANAALKAEEASLEAMQLSFEIAEIRHSTGMITAGDYLKALSDMETRRNSFNGARRNQALTWARFLSIIGSKVEINIEDLQEINFDNYEEIITRLNNISDTDSDELFNNFWNYLLDSNLSLKQAALNTERAERNHSMVLRDLSPTITATIFSGGITYTNELNTTPASAFISLRGTIPLDFWILANRIERSSGQKESTYIDYNNIVSQLELELKSVLLNLYSAAANVLSSRRSLEYTERHYEFVAERYRMSLAGVSELQDALSLFITSRNNHIRSTYFFLQALSRLRSLCAIEKEEELLQMLLDKFDI